jgi:hypothetical protein
MDALPRIETAHLIVNRAGCTWWERHVTVRPKVLSEREFKVTDPAATVGRLMSKVHVQINPRRGGRFQGSGAADVFESVEAAIKPLDALPGDALWVESAEGDYGHHTFIVENCPRGLVAVPA